MEYNDYLGGAIFVVCIILLLQTVGVFEILGGELRLRERFITAFGRLVSRPSVFKFIQWYAGRTPHTHLYDTLAQPEAGEHTYPLYMGRWRVVNRGSIGSWLLKLVSGYESCRLHYIARPDHDRDLHNHPFRYRTFVLHGWYGASVSFRRHVEWQQQPNGKVVGEWYYFSEPRYVFNGHGDSDSLGPKDWHRITTMHGGGVWTLFFMTDNTEEWGFLTKEGYVESREYFKRKRA